MNWCSLSITISRNNNDNYGGKNVDYIHKGENRHSKKIEDLENEKPISNLKTKIKEELEKSDREQQILLKENKQNIIDFLSANKESIRVEDLKIYEPIYKCNREKRKLPYLQ